MRATVPVNHDLIASKVTTCGDAETVAGPMQVVTSRMRYISSQKEGDGEAPIRIVGLCTSLANAKDLGEWIGATSHGLFNFPPGAPSTVLLRSACHEAQ